MQIETEQLWKSWRHLVAVVSIMLLIGLVATIAPRPAHSASSSTLTGWAWSDTIGWISMSGTGYGLSMDNTTGVVTGYAWSDSIGWISANSADIASCAASAVSQVDLSAGQWNGWLRAIAGGSVQSGGWDGCISMSGASYGVSYDKTTGKFGQTSKFAWEGNTDPGAAVIGWVDFSGASTTPAVLACTSFVGSKRCGIAVNGEDSNSIYQTDTLNNQCKISTCGGGLTCSNGACVSATPPPVCNLSSGTNCIEVHPSLVGPGNVGTTVSWNVSNVKNVCSVTGTNGDGKPAPQPGWSTTADASSNAVGTHLSSTITISTTYTLTCTGLDNLTHTWSVTAAFAPSFKEF